jgi:hypothetical protein
VKSMTGRASASGGIIPPNAHYTAIRGHGAAIGTTFPCPFRPLLVAVVGIVSTGAEVPRPSYHQNSVRAFEIGAQWDINAPLAPPGSAASSSGLFFNASVRAPAPFCHSQHIENRNSEHLATSTSQRTMSYNVPEPGSEEGKTMAQAEAIASKSELDRKRQIEAYALKGPKKTKPKDGWLKIVGQYQEDSPMLRILDDGAKIKNDQPK